jgi:hypothetical protein
MKIVNLYLDLIKVRDFFEAENWTEISNYFDKLKNILADQDNIPADYLFYITENAQENLSTLFDRNFGRMPMKNGHGHIYGREYNFFFNGDLGSFKSRTVHSFSIEMRTDTCGQNVYGVYKNATLRSEPLEFVRYLTDYFIDRYGI